MTVNDFEREFRELIADALDERINTRVVGMATLELCARAGAAGITWPQMMAAITRLERKTA